jgi:acetyl-CoA acetyltransferase
VVVERVGCAGRARGWGGSTVRTQAAVVWAPGDPWKIEEIEFCGRGEAKDFATVENLSLGGRLPINTAGGLLGEAYIHGMNAITEAVRQIRGTSCNQVEDVEHVLVTAGTGVPTSGLILGRT